MNKLLTLLATASMATFFVSCERHSWEDETKHLFEEHGGGDADHNHPAGDHKGHDHPEKDH